MQARRDDWLHDGATHGRGCNQPSPLCRQPDALSGKNRGCSVDLANARPNAPAWLTLGTSDRNWSGIPLPFDLTGVGAAGCRVLAAADVVGGVTTSATGTGTFPLLVPNVGAFGGRMLFNQFVVSDPTANGLGLALSNGGKMTLGR